MELKRLFIGGLYPDAKEEDLKERFSRFGEINSIEIKKRIDSEGNPSNTFAYISIRSSDADIKKCISTFNKVTWKGGKIRLQLAKENFLERLEKEREEAKQGSESPEKVKKQRKSKTIQAVLVQPLSDIPGIENFHLKGAPPGPLPGQENWVVAKYGRVLPVVQMKKKGARNMLKVDPSKLTHNVKRFNDEADKSKALASLSWQMETSDNDITRRRKGDFPEWTPPVKKKKKITAPVCVDIAREETLVSRNDEDFEIAPQSLTISSSISSSADKLTTGRNSKSNRDLSRFDSESDDEMDSPVRTDADKTKTSFNVSKVGKEPVNADCSSKKETQQKKKQISENKSVSMTKKKKLEVDIGVKSKIDNKGLCSGNAKTISRATRNRTMISYNAMDEYFSGINNPLESENIIENDAEYDRTGESDDEYSDFESFVKAEEKKLKKMPVKNMSNSVEMSGLSSSIHSSFKTDTGRARRVYNSDSDDSEQSALPAISDASRDASKKPSVMKKVTKVSNKVVTKELSKWEETGSFSVVSKAKCEEADPLSVGAKASAINEKVSSHFVKTKNVDSALSESDSNDSEESGSESDDEYASSSDGSSSSESVVVTKIKSPTDEAKSESLTSKINTLQTPKNICNDKENVSNIEKKGSFSKENLARAKPASSLNTSAVQDNIPTHPGTGADSDSTSDDDESMSSASSSESEAMSEGTSENESNTNTSENDSNTNSNDSPLKTDQYKQNDLAGTKTIEDIVSNNQKQNVSEIKSKFTNLKSKLETDKNSPDDESASSSGCEEMSEGTSEYDSTTDLNRNSLNQHKEHISGSPKAIISMASNNKKSKSELTKSNSKHETDENSSDDESASSPEDEEMSEGTSENDSTADSSDISVINNKHNASAGTRNIVDIVANDKNDKVAEAESEYTTLKSKHVIKDDESESDESSESDSDFEKLICKEMEKVNPPQKTKETKSVVKKVDKETNADTPAKDSQTILEEKLKKLKSIDNLDSYHKSDSSDSDSSNEKDEYKPINTKEMLLKHAGAATQCLAKESSDKDKNLESKEKQKNSKLTKTEVSLKEKQDTERKRMEAVKKKQKEHSAKLSAIRAALANVDTGVKNNKKVVFDSDGEEKESVPDVSKQHEKKEIQEKSNHQTSNKLSTLFDSSSDSEGEADMDITRFNIRPEFEGPGGKKLMKLQSRFGNDERFKLTANFAESDSNSEDSDEGLSDDEKTKSLKILQSVVNTDLAKTVDKTAKQKKKFKDVSQLKYDPLKKDHSQFEVQVTPQENTEKKSKKKKGKVDAEEPVPVPEVSKEKFYQVSEAVIDTFAKKESQPAGQGFSLLAAFGKVASDNEEEDMETEETSIRLHSPVLQTEQTSFKTDNESDDKKKKKRNSQREDEKVAPEKPVTSETAADKSGPSNSSKDSKMPGKSIPGKSVPERKSTSTFFFTQDDSRLKEGEQFYRHEDIEVIQERWKQKRPELIQNYKAKQKVMKRRIKVRGGGHVGGRGGAGGRGGRARGRGRGGGRGSGRGRMGHTS